MRDSQTVIVLGAGASAAEGAPIQSTLFREYFKYYRSNLSYGTQHAWDHELVAFFHSFFGIDVDHDELDKTGFPTFEEILGILELADAQSDSFRDWPSNHLINNGTSRIRHVHDLLIYLIAEILQEKLNNTKNIHRILLQNLGEKLWLEHTAFVSFNYDILIDNALLDICGEHGFHYSIPFVNQPLLPIEITKRQIPLFKLHGSLNWLYCSACRDMYITPYKKSVSQIKRQPEVSTCQSCRNPRSPIIIPPTFFKVMSNLFLRTIWDSAERECGNVQRIVFCGYSFPDADVHVKYLLKRVEINNQRTPEIFVVNSHPGKKPETIEEELWRFRRFFVTKNNVHYTNLTFEDFANDPKRIEDSATWVL